MLLREFVAQGQCALDQVLRGISNLDDAIEDDQVGSGQLLDESLGRKGFA